MRPRVSVVVPTKDRPETLPAALRSILEQKMQDFEIIVVNDGGADVAPLLQDDRIVYVRSERSGGRARACNRGIARARGEFVCFLDDDDVYLDHHFGALLRFLGRHPESGAVYPALAVNHFRWIDGREALVDRTVWHHRFDFRRLLRENIFPENWAMYRRRTLQAIGGFDPRALLGQEDWEMGIRYAQRFGVGHLPEITGVYRRGAAYNHDSIFKIARFRDGFRATFLKHQEVYRSLFTLREIRAIEATNRVDLVK